ncbi:MAG TPA: penicillin-binding protein 2 [Chloroflexi bacterium]|nr:penicillin-binding protein 2 [Chloroflexota bacterium]HBY06289.1 penicillin-binding protein 2 [Chloroflexota bacterium]
MSSSATLSNRIAPWRVWAFVIVLALIFGIFLLRVFQYQVIQGSEFIAQAEENRISEISLPTLRGVIYDRNGIVLARNVASYNLVVVAANLPDSEGAIQEIFRQLSALVDWPVNLGDLETAPYNPCVSELGIAQVVTYAQTSSPYSAVKILCNIDEDVARIIQEKAIDWPGIQIEVESVRDYPTGELTASLIGFLGPISAADEAYYRERGYVPNRDKVGYAGLERYYETILSGKPGKRVVEVDVAGQIVRDIRPTIPPIPGQNLYLTIDLRLQEAAQTILLSEIDAWNTYLDKIQITSGVIIAMNPRTGEVLAMVNYPTYENNRMARIIPGYYYLQLLDDVRDPLLNHAVGAELPAGSVFKITTAVGALNEGVVTPEQVIKTPGYIEVTEKYAPNDPGFAKRFVDWIYKNGANPGGFGELDFLGGISNSSNVYFYKLGGGYEDEVPEGLGICRLGSYARAMGYGAYPGIELPDVADGLVPDPRWKRITQGENWAIGDTYIASVGQGFVIATPLQILMSAATIANDGKLMRPTVIHEITDPDGRTIQTFQPEMKWDLTKDPMIDVYADPASAGGCEAKLTGEKKIVQPWVFAKVQEGMRKAVTDGTLSVDSTGFSRLTIPAAGKTGTAEYCDEFAAANNLCVPGLWPSHAWTVAYAPYENPEIAVIAFAYNGGEGAPVAGPMVRRVLEAYFELKSIDSALGNP